MIGAAAAYMSGLFFASFFSGAKGILMLAAGAVLVYFLGRLREFTLKDYSKLAVLFAAGFSVFTLYTAARYTPAVELDGSCGDFSGKVTDIRLYDGDKALYTLSGETDSGLHLKLNYTTDDLGAEYGDRITLENCRFKKPGSDYLFDSQSWYRSRGIFLIVYSAENTEIEHKHSSVIKNALISYRERIIGEYSRVMGEDCGSFLTGMTFGIKQDMDSSVMTALYRCGIGHILAVSGLHISIIASLLMVLLKRLNLKPLISFGIMNFLMLLLIIMANSPVSAVRAAIMMDIFYFAPIVRRENDTLNSLACAVLAICAAEPYIVYSSGFMLSVSGTFGIGVFAPYMTEKMKRSTFLDKTKFSFVTALCTTISVFPLSMYYFDEVSLISPVSNILFVPLCTGAMIFGVLFLITGGIFTGLLLPAKLLLLPVIWTTNKLGNTGVIYLSHGRNENAYILIAAGAIIVLYHLAGAGRDKIKISLCAACIIFCAAAAGMKIYDMNRLTVTVLGKGNNAAVVICKRNSYDIIDLSGHYRSAEYVRKYISVNGGESPDSILLTKNVQAQYAAYSKEFEILQPEKWTVAGETPVYGGGEVRLLGNGSFELINEDFTAEYSDDVLVIRQGDSEVTISAANSGKGSDSGLSVYYGNITSGNIPDRSGNAVYLDEDENTGESISGINDFEITFTDSSRFKIRRL